MERLLQFMLKPRAMFSVFFLTGLSFFFIDRSIATYVYSLNLKANWPWLSWITHLGLGEVYFGLFLTLALFFRYISTNPKLEARIWFLLLCVSIPDIICLGLKVILGRARPELLFSSDLYGFYGFHLEPSFWSFPSGHTTSIFGLIFGLCIVFPRYRVSFFLLGIIVATSRILLNCHYLSDIMTASYLTLVEIAIVLNILQRKSWLAPAWSKQYNSKAPSYG